MTLAIKSIPRLLRMLAVGVVMCLSALVLMTFSSCSDNDDNPANQPEPADMVRLVSLQSETISGPLTMTTQTYNVWENGRLMQQTNSASTMGITTEVGEVLTYDESGLCTEMYTVDGDYHHYYTYTPDGRIAKEVYLGQGDTVSVTEVVAYDAYGNIAETIHRMPAFSVTRKNSLTWQDGDLVEAVVEYVSEGKETETFTYTYDNYPSAYIGYPVAIGNDVKYLAIHCSKHNLIEPGFTPSYENGRLVSLVKDDGSDNMYFTYDDGTGQR